MSSKENRPVKMKFFGVREFSIINFVLKNGFKNEFKDNKEKSWS